MRMTNAIREQILDAVVKDLPKLPDFEAERQAVVDKEAFEQLPIELQVAVQRNKEVKSYLRCDHHWGELHVRVTNPHYEPSEATNAACKAINARARAANDERDKLKRDIMGVLHACTTTEKLIKMLPEFEKYIPSEAAVNPGVPCTQVIAQLMQAGWKQNAKDKDGA